MLLYEANAEKVFTGGTLKVITYIVKYFRFSTLNYTAILPLNNFQIRIPPALVF